ncbi:MAG TPA: hypothetical protein PLV68_09575, partial [Ilumatobacteraceae bacterium]|nr:hypothetical protein [Ilumatobacteraceae bacterium]
TGNVNVIVDVVGYYDDHRHSAADIIDEPGVVYNFKNDATAIGTNTTILSVPIRVPADGYLVMEATANFLPQSVGTD